VLEYDRRGKNRRGKGKGLLGGPKAGKGMAKGKGKAQEVLVKMGGLPHKRSAKGRG